MLEWKFTLTVKIDGEIVKSGNDLSISDVIAECARLNNDYMVPVDCWIEIVEEDTNRTIYLADLGEVGYELNKWIVQLSNEMANPNY